MPIPLGIWAVAGASSAAANSFDLLSTATLSSTGTFNFASIPQEYTHFRMHWSLRDSDATTNGVVRIRLNDDAGSNYFWNFFVQSPQGGSGTQFGALSNSTTPGNNSNSNWFGSGILNFENATNTSITKSVDGHWGGIMNTGGTGNPSFIGMSWNSTAAINKISIYTNGSGYVSGSTISLYGIKGVV